MHYANNKQIEEETKKNSGTMANVEPPPGINAWGNADAINYGKGWNEAEWQQQWDQHVNAVATKMWEEHYGNSGYPETESIDALGKGGKGGFGGKGGKGFGGKGSKGNCFNCGQPGHMTRNCANPVRCNSCGMSGHKGANCPKGKGKGGYSGTGGKDYGGNGNNTSMLLR